MPHTLAQVDEATNPLPSASAALGEEVLESEGQAEIRVPSMVRPVSMVVEAPGYLRSLSRSVRATSAPT